MAAFVLLCLSTVTALAQNNFSKYEGEWKCVLQGVFSDGEAWSEQYTYVIDTGDGTDPAIVYEAVHHDGYTSSNSDFTNIRVSDGMLYFDCIQTRNGNRNDSDDYYNGVFIATKKVTQQFSAKVIGNRMIVTRYKWTVDGYDANGRFLRLDDYSKDGGRLTYKKEN